MTSWVYVVGAEGQRPVKIGHTGNVVNRIQNLQVGNPWPLELRAAYRGGRVLEQRLHSQFAALRLTGEWFDFGDQDPLVPISRFVREHRGIPEYRELVRVRKTPAERVPLNVRIEGVLAILGSQSGQSLTQLARQMGASKSVAKKAVDLLIQEGQIIRLTDGLLYLNF